MKDTVMKKIHPLVIIILYSFSNTFASESAPDSAYIFAYTTEKNGGRNGLHVAWSIDKKDWHAVGPEFSFLRSDYGTWGGEKRMYTPFLFQATGGVWHAVWSVNDRDGAFAHATSADLINWRPQSYPIVSPDKNVLLPEISYDQSAQQYVVSWASKKGTAPEFYSARTRDFTSCSLTWVMPEAERLNLRQDIRIGDSIETGTVHTVTWELVESLIEEYQLVTYNEQLDRETTDGDPIRFKDLKPVDVTITVDGKNSKKISDLLIGVFFEDINYAADGGLYTELIQNRGFEYSLHDKKLGPVANIPICRAHQEIAAPVAAIAPNNKHSLRE
jgi:hypothetical protein